MTNNKTSKITIEDHIKKAESRDLIDILREKIKELDNKTIQKYSTKPYIGYNLTKTRTLFVELHVQKSKIVLHLRPIDYINSKLTICEKPSSHNWTLNKLVDIYNKNDLDFAIELIKQSYTDVLSRLK
jgi:predicted transport protein